MRWFVAWAAAIVFVAGVSGSPIDVPTPSSELLPPLEDSVADLKVFEEPATELIPTEELSNLPTLSTDLQPPPLEQSKDTWLTPKKNVSATLFLINIYSIKNQSAEDSNDVLHSDVFKEVPDDVVEPLAMFLLIVEDKDEDHPVSLDEVAKDLEAEGFIVEKIDRDGETRLIKVDIGSVETTERVNDEDSDMSNAIERIARELGEKKEEEGTPINESSGKLMKFRRKRHACLKCKLEEIRARKHGYGCQGGCGGGGGYYPPPQYQPVQVVPIYAQPRPQPYYPPVQPCTTCGGYNHGGGNAHAQASAQASASAQSW